MSTGQPTGTVTHLFTDIEGSTKLWERHPEAMQAALARHDAILRDAIQEHTGHVVKSTGDGFYAVFPTASAGLGSALAAQRALQAETWGEAVIKVRMGLHSGAADERDGDYFGPVLSRAARIMSAGHGGQILLSRVTRELVRDQLPAGVELCDLGKQRLRGLDRPEQVFQVIAPGLPSEFPALRTLEARPQNLPVQTTPFVGREAELADLRRLLADPSVRLLTITGAGGMGKTRLALEAAAAQLDSFAHGVHFASLAPLQSAEALVPTIAESLGFTFYEGGEPRRQLLDYLRHKRLLLILDNFEHLLGGPEPDRGDGANLVSDILASAREVKALVTSRVRLNLLGECLFHLAGMDIPDCEAAGDAPGMEAWVDYSAVKLFLQTARRVRPDLRLAAPDRRHVIRVCRLVGGMPLGILLAAGWLTMLSPAEIAAEIEASLDFLETDLRNLPERQRSLRAVSDYSWKLLSGREQAVMRALSVFRGGFTREAAHQVTGATLRELAALIDKSWLQRNPAGRYGIHEVLRQYAADRLSRADGVVEAQSEEHAIRDTHATYYAAFLASRDAPLRGMEQKQPLAEIRPEVDNVRTAWDWAVSQGRVDVIEQAQAPLARFCRIRGWYAEGEALFSRAAQRLSRMDDDRVRFLQGKLLLQRGRFAELVGNRAESHSLLEQSLAIFRQHGAVRETAYALCLLGGCERMYGRMEGGELCREGLGLFRRLGDPQGIALALYGLAWSDLYSGEYAAAETGFEESTALFRQVGDLERIQSALHGLGYICWILGEYERGRDLHLEMLGLCREGGSQGGTARALGDLGMDTYGLRSYQESYDYFQRSLALYQEVGDPHGVTDVLSDLADWSTTVGDYRQAYDLVQASLDILRQRLPPSEFLPFEMRVLGEATFGLGDTASARRYFYLSLEAAQDRPAWPAHQLMTLVSVARLLGKQGDRERALELLALVTNHRVSWQRARDEAAPLIAELESELPPDVSAAAWERGRARDLEATVAELIVELGGEEIA